MKPLSHAPENINHFGYQLWFDGYCELGKPSFYLSGIQTNISLFCP